MPRAAGRGISFQFTANGREYIANMSDTMSLKSGYKYTFNINLKETQITVGADIEPWVEGPTTNYDALEISTPADSSMNVEPGDRMNVYLKGASSFAILDTFTYTQQGNWIPTAPVYWQNIPDNPATFRSSMVKNPAINNTQLPEILVSEEIDVTRNTGANFTLRRAVTKAVVKLQSNTFTAQQLANATITFPNYLTGGKEENGVFVAGQDHVNIVVDRRDPDNGIAIFQPQNISSRGIVAKVTIDNRDYTAYAGDYGLPFKAGEASLLVINLNQDVVSLSAKVIDWIDLPASYFDVFEIGTPADASVGVEPGDQMNVYVQANGAFNLLKTFTYSDLGKWITDPVLYWEDISANPAVFKASMVASPALNATQLPDILIANQISVAQYKPANFVFNHAATKVEVRLASSIFTTVDLAKATITLPNYLTGGREDKATFIPGQTRNNILVDRKNPENSIAIFQAQSISAGTPMVKISINGRDYTAYAGTGGYNFKAGEANLLVITLNKEQASVSAKVIDWVNQPAANFDVLAVSTPAGATEGVADGSQMNVYLNENNAYNLLRTFTYNNNVWTTTSPVYWESINDNPAKFRSSILAVAALNSTQLADILISDEISVPQNTGANFTLRHAAAKVVVGLVSTTFTQQELNNATVILPNYLSGGYEQNGSFIPGNVRSNIQVDRTNPAAGVALIQPQVISPGGTVIQVVINGVAYSAAATGSGVNFEAGKSQALVVTVNKTGTSVSARVIDWTDANPLNFNVVTVGTPVSGAVGVLNDEQMNVYTDNGANRPLLSTFTYTQATNQWSSPSPVYWESLNDPTTFYASILRQGKHNTTQLDDYLIATPVQVAAANGVNFTLAHPAAKIVVQLRSSDSSFTATELAQMNMVLPGYATGGTFTNGVFTPGNSTNDIIVAKNVGPNGNSAIAIIQPQIIPANATVLRINDPGTGRVYNATLPTSVSFAAGVSTVLNVDIKKTLASMSANVVDWINGDIISMVPVAIRVTGSLDNSSDFFRNKTIRAYKYGTNFQSLAYTYLPGTNGYAWTGEYIYWDDNIDPSLNVTAVYYPSENMIPAITASTLSFPWNLPAVQSQGYDYYDLLTSHLVLTSPQYINFVFNHPLSKARVELSSSEFTPAELTGATVQLNGFLMNGSIMLATGAASPVGGALSVIPNTDVDGSKYSALVMPQIIPGGTGVVTITLKGYPNTPFTGTISTPLNFTAGKETVIKVNLKKTKIELSATLENWTAGDEGNIIIQ